MSALHAHPEWADDLAQLAEDLTAALTAAQERVEVLEAAIGAVCATGFLAAKKAQLDAGTVVVSAVAWSAYRKATLSAGWVIGQAHPACAADLQPIPTATNGGAA